MADNIFYTQVLDEDDDVADGWMLSGSDHFVNVNTGEVITADQYARFKRRKHKSGDDSNGNNGGNTANPNQYIQWVPPPPPTPTQFKSRYRDQVLGNDVLDKKSSTKKNEKPKAPLNIPVAIEIPGVINRNKLSDRKFRDEGDEQPQNEIVKKDILRKDGDNIVTDGYGMPCKWERIPHQKPTNPRERHVIENKKSTSNFIEAWARTHLKPYHADMIDAIYFLSGSDAAYPISKSKISGKEELLTKSETKSSDVIDVYRIKNFLVSKSNVDMLDLYLAPSGIDYNEYTNVRSAYLVKDDSGMAQIEFVNYMMGNFVKGIGSENYIFPEHTKMSRLMRSAGITKRALKEWLAKGKPDNYFTKIEYGPEAQAKNAKEDAKMFIYDKDFIPFFTVENFVGSADFNIFYTANGKSILVTLTNVTSLTSGDIAKHFDAHGPWPNSKARNPCNPLPQPYTNISQTFNMKFDINDYFFRDLNLDRIEEPY